MTPKRDTMEIELTHLALARRMPILGICRGAQLLAVAGDFLYQDINMQISRNEVTLNSPSIAERRIFLCPSGA
jgi:gamma-glutamyl-gamma-aminobutyrate hydrolase PuuD